MVMMQTNLKLIESAQKVQVWSRKILDKAPLTALQREDLLAIYDASDQFVRYATDHTAVIMAEIGDEAKREVRHQLGNYLNVIIGFSQLLVKELPDNLLLHMAIIRQISQTGEHLRQQVDAIR
ncbi:MAG: hypothetical protein ACFE0Q_15175 [Anaerolineae bacterium]